MIRGRKSLKTHFSHSYLDFFQPIWDLKAMSILKRKQGIKSGSIKK